MRTAKSHRFVLLIVLVLAVPALRAETGYELWLRYPLAEQPYRGSLRAAATSLRAAGDSVTMQAAVAELETGIARMTGARPETVDRVRRRGTIVLGTPANSTAVAALHLPLAELGDEGFVVRATRLDGRRVIAVAANTDVGVLYGTFELLRQMQMQAELAKLDIISKPRMKLRLLNHWDNLNGFVERGYAGASLWDWQKLPEYRDPRYIEYARADASLGINGAVLNNVNANAGILTPLYLEKVAAIADAFRPWGIRVYLSARFSAPVEIGGLDTADPLDAGVRGWWRAKADEIYALIPDFGGFLVKANSEGQPGPQDYGRNHADGANLLADALAPHGGVVMWRAFVYSAANREDRVRQAYDEFVPLDGQFRPNVLIQVKNGPLDFQPREPFHPLFGAAPKTPLMMEFQITKEYLGFETHLAYLGTLWEEVLKSDTYAHGPGSTVARVIDGSLDDHALTGIAGVSNVGADIDWTGSTFTQANWYAFGRLAWDPDLTARAIAEEWVRQTFSNEAGFVRDVVDLMMVSREAVVNYMTPLGLAHLMATGHHYGPGPWVDDLGRDDWNPVYYHRADADGIGFDRTESGSDAAAQYHDPLASRFESPADTPENLLLWFHHLPWDYEISPGKTLWADLVEHYDRGVDTVAALRASWDTLGDRVDAQRYAKTKALLAIQEREAKWWRNACIAYFQSISGLPLPAGVAAPPHSLDYYERIEFPHLAGY